VSYKLQIVGTESFTKRREIGAKSLSLRRNYASEDRVMAGKTINDLCTFKLSNFRLTRFQKVIQVLKIYIFERRAEFLGAGMKVQWKENGGRIMLGDNTGGGVVGLRQITFLDVGFQLDCLVCAYISDSIYSQFRLAQNATCDGPSGG